MKYLGVLLDEHLKWSPQIWHVQMKLNPVIEILSKLRYQANIHMLKTVYCSLIWTYYLYACQLWGQNNKETSNQFRTLQNRALKKITFKNRYEIADPLYKNLKIPKFQDLLRLNNCSIIFQLKQKKKLAVTRSAKKPLRYVSLPNLHLWDEIMQIPLH